MNNEKFINLNQYYTIISHSYYFIYKKDNKNNHSYSFTYYNIQSKLAEAAFFRATLDHETLFQFSSRHKTTDLSCVFRSRRECAHLRDTYIHDSVNCWSCRWDYLNLNRVARWSRRGALFVVRENPPPVFQVLSWDARDGTLYVYIYMYL